MPQAPERTHVQVANPGLPERVRECVAIELRVVPGARNGADVDDPLDAVRLQKRNEIVQRSVGVPDGENGDAQALFSR